MKKLLAILLALAVVGFVAVAEDAPKAGLTGYVYYTTNLLDQDGNVSTGPDWLSNGHYSTLGLAYNSGKVGFSGTIEFEDDAINSAFRDYTAWAKPFGDYVKISAGKLRNGDYRLTSYIDGSGFNSRISGSGLLVQAYPIAGLSVGAFVPASDTAVAIGDVKYAFGAAYTIDKIAKVVALYNLGNDELFVGFDVKAVAGLTLKLGFTNDSTVGGEFNRIWATAAYSVVENLELACDAYYKLATTNTLYGKVQASYTIDAFTPSAYFALTSAAATTWSVGAQVATGGVYLGLDYNSDGTFAVPLSVEVAF